MVDDPEASGEDSLPSDQESAVRDDALEENQEQVQVEQVEVRPEVQEVLPTMSETTSKSALNIETNLSKIKIPALSGKETYIAWRTRFLMIMEAFGRKDLFTGDSKCPEEPEDSKSVVEWKNMDTHAKILMLDAIQDDNDFMLVKDCKTAYEYLQALNEYYDRESQYKAYTLQSRLQNERLLPGKSVKDHIALLKDFRRQLESCNFKMPDEYFANQILMSLPADPSSPWATTIAIMENEQRNGQLTLQKLVGALLEAEEKMNGNAADKAYRSILDRVSKTSVLDRLEDGEGVIVVAKAPPEGASLVFVFPRVTKGPDGAPLTSSVEQ